MSSKKLKFTFDIGTIDHLGVKLYSTIPPMLAELISNAWDADAHNVYLNFVDGSDKSISIKDDGIGMDFNELNEKFLKIGRNRRVETGTDKTIGGRPVLGKKGLGKLSMFGIGKRITVSTVKNGKKNTFIMNYDDIKKVSNTKTYEPVIVALDEETTETHGTYVLIENLARRTGFDVNGFRASILNRFSIFSADFQIHINDKDELLIKENNFMETLYQFIWKFPDDFFKEKEANKSLFEFAENNNIYGTIYTSPTPLPKTKQGIVLFSRGKLVQESMSFNSRGNDNFFQYMAGNFCVDFVDESLEIDNCSTDRKSLAWDSYGNTDLDYLNQLLERIVSITQSKWRQARKDEKKKKVQSRGIDIDEWLKNLNRAEQPLARKLVDAILENDEISDEASNTYIGCIKDMYGFTGFQDFTTKLDDLGILGNENAIKLLTDWSEIEAKEFAKISLGRIKTIDQFEKYIRENASETKVIQKFLAEFPWLLDSRMSKFEREITYSKILKENFNDNELPESDRRIDFLCTNDSGIIHIIELKRPCVKLTYKQLQQISAYVEFIKHQYPEQAKEVYGYLISDNMTYELGAEIMRDGLRTQNIFIKSYSDLLAEARTYNKNLYDLYTKIEDTKKDSMGN